MGLVDLALAVKHGLLNLDHARSLHLQPGLEQTIDPALIAFAHRLEAARDGAVEVERHLLLGLEAYLGRLMARPPLQRALADVPDNPFDVPVCPPSRVRPKGQSSNA